MRLHPAPREWLTVVVRRDDPRALAAAARELTHRPLEAERLDLRWEGDARRACSSQLCGAVGARARARAIDGEVVEDDEELWAAQRAAQRGPVVLRVSTTQQGLADVLAPRATTARSAWRAPPTASPGCASRPPTPSS